MHQRDQPGLSPRVRGNRRRGRPGNGSNRSIPARAGEPGLVLGLFLRTRVYPRACGGTQRTPFRVRDLQGLSPRVRGNPGGGFNGRRPARSIPARAGEPVGHSNLPVNYRVYPRACGGTGHESFVHFVIHGLSPRVRGNRGHTAHRLRAGGSIPARAGEPCSPCILIPTQRVYPRACGGTFTMSHFHFKISGLSPRVRGNLCYLY